MSTFQFTDASHYPYKPGSFFLGLDEAGKEVGISTERHLITVASAGSGKGTCLIVPNLRRWGGSAIVVDPKGENATLTAADRLAKGQTVGVLDPYHIAQGAAAELRCSINPLSLIDPDSLSAGAEMEALADGFIRRYDPKHGQWDDMAASFIAGLIDFILNTCEKGTQNLLSLRSLLTQTDDELKGIALAMIETETSSGLSKEAGTSLLRKLANNDSVEAAGWGKAKKETAWISDRGFREMFSNAPAFDMAAIKNGTGTLYLCIRADHLETRGSFLRLFVRLGLMVMMSDLVTPGKPSGRCLFLLDEFYTLGRVELIAKAAGLMRGYGVQLWPFVQDLSQLHSVYQQDYETFFSNADAHVFFGVNDKLTSHYVSDSLGAVTPEEVGMAPLGGIGLPITGAATSAVLGAMVGRRGGGMGAAAGAAVGLAGAGINMAIQASHQAAMAEFEQKKMALGRPRLSPDEVRVLLGKPDGFVVVPRLLVFAKAGHALLISPAPYFVEDQKREKETNPAYVKKRAVVEAAINKELKKYKRQRAWLWGITIFLGFCALQNKVWDLGNILGIALIMGVPIVLLGALQAKIESVPKLLDKIDTVEDGVEEIKITWGNKN